MIWPWKTNPHREPRARKKAPPEFPNCAIAHVPDSHPDMLAVGFFLRPLPPCTLSPVSRGVQKFRRHGQNLGQAKPAT
jgi:hypothetical protein